LRDAFDRMVRDQAFMADAAKRNLDLEPAPGATVQGYSIAIVNAPADLVEGALQAMAAEKK
jgi:hypothetical protein